MTPSLKHTAKKNQKKSASLLQKALDFATDIHAHTKRKSGEPYIIHPIAVKNILEKHGFPEQVLCAALLHDVLEDTDDVPTTEKRLFRLFGDEVYFLVTALSKDGKLADKQVRDEKYFEQISLAMQRDPSIIFLKAADLLHNVSTLKYLKKEKQEAWISELKNFYLRNFLKNFHLIPIPQREFYHQLIRNIQKVIDRFEKKSSAGTKVGQRVRRPSRARSGGVARS